MQLRSFLNLDDDDANPQEYQRRLQAVFEKAEMPNRTVIITAVNAAWAENNTMIDLFLQSFHHGQGTERLLRHLIIVCLDERAYDRCVENHPLCLKIRTGGVDFSGEQIVWSRDYVKMIWRRVKFLKTALHLNYSFVFTDTDVIWLRDPFPHLEQAVDADFQISCDLYNGNPTDVHNSPNAGFVYVRANERTVNFYEYWYRERWRYYERKADQEVFNKMKLKKRFQEIGMKIRFLDTQWFGGLCSLETTDMRKAVAMHANCCRGLAAKLVDLSTILEEWKQYQQKPLESNGSAAQFRLPYACPLSWHLPSLMH